MKTKIGFYAWAVLYMKNKIQKANLRHNLNLRSVQNDNLIIPKSKTEFFRKSLAYAGPRIWNGIPLHIRSSDSLRKFQIAYMYRYVQWQFSNWFLHYNNLSLFVIYFQLPNRFMFCSCSLYICFVLCWLCMIMLYICEARMEDRKTEYVSLIK